MNRYVRRCVAVLFFGVRGRVRALIGATRRAFGKRRHVAALQNALQIVQVEIVDPKVRRHQLVQQRAFTPLII